MTLGDFGYSVGYITVGIFLGFIIGFSRGQISGRRTGKVEGWIYSYKELVTRLKARGELEKKPFIEKKSIEVLVVENNDDARQILASALRLYGFHVTEARNGSDGLSHASTGDSHVAIVDIFLPDGLDIAKKIRGDPKCAGMKLIALAGASDADEKNALNSGYDIYMVKPYQLDKLVEAIQK